MTFDMVTIPIIENNERARKIFEQSNKFCSPNGIIVNANDFIRSQEYGRNIRLLNNI